MASQVAVTGLGGRPPLVAFLERSSRYTMSLASSSSISMTKPQNCWGISLYVRKSLDLSARLLSGNLVMAP